jgi:tetratricopeptide (TPR) repeat protein
LKEIDSQNTWVDEQKAFLLQKENILSLLRARKENEAIDKLSVIINADSLNLWALCQRGLLYDKNGKHKEAITDYVKTLSVPKSDGGFLSRDRNDEKGLNFRRAIRWTIHKLSDLISENPERGMLFRHRGLLYLKSRTDRNDINSTIDDFASMITLNTEVSWASQYRAELLMEADRNNEAIDELSRLMNLETMTDEEWHNRAWAYEKTARLYEKMGECDKAFEVYSQKLKLNMNPQMVYDSISRLLEKCGKKNRVENLSTFTNDTFTATQ